MNFVKRLELELTSSPDCAPMSAMGKKGIEKRQVGEIAARLKAGREAVGLKPSQLCDLTGVKRNTYSQWEAGKGRPNLDEAMRLCDALGYTLDWIYLGDPSGLPMALAQKLGVAAVAPQKSKTA